MATSATPGPVTLDSTASMLAMLPPDSGDADTTESSESSDSSQTSEEPVEASPESAPETEEAPAVEAAAPEEPVAEPEEEKKKAAPEELPEGVIKSKNSDGKPGLFVTPERWKTIYGHHQAVQQVSEAMGAPATPEDLVLHHDAFDAQERMFDALNSADPGEQRQVIDYWLEEMARAQQSGEVGYDPAIPFARSMYSSIAERNPQAYFELRLMAARDLIQEMFEAAAASDQIDEKTGQRGDVGLWNSAQHFTRMLTGVTNTDEFDRMLDVAADMGLPFYDVEDMQKLRGAADPNASLRAENERLRAQLNGGSVTNEAAQLDSWHNQTNQLVGQAIQKDAIQPALASVANAPFWKKNPEDFRRLVLDPLHSEIMRTITSDQGFWTRLQGVIKQAGRAASAQRRADLSQQIAQMYANRARMAAEVVKGPILKFAATHVEQRSAQNHDRREAGQNQSVVKGATAPPNRGLLPKDMPQFRNGEYDPKTAMKQLEALFR